MQTLFPGNQLRDSILFRWFCMRECSKALYKSFHTISIANQSFETSSNWFETFNRLECLKLNHMEYLFTSYWFSIYCADVNISCNISTFRVVCFELHQFIIIFAICHFEIPKMKSFEIQTWWTSLQEHFHPANLISDIWFSSSAQRYFDFVFPTLFLFAVFRAGSNVINFDLSTEWTRRKKRREKCLTYVCQQDVECEVLLLVSVRHENFFDEKWG